MGRPARNLGVRSQRDRARRHRQAGFGRRVMGDRLRQQIVETSAVAALGGGVVDRKQRLGFGAADRLMLDGACGEDARAPGGVIGIERAGKMHTAFGRGALAGQHAVAHDGQRMGSRVAAGGFGNTKRFNALFNTLGLGRHSHSHTSQFSFLFWSRASKRVVNDSKP